MTTPLKGADAGVYGDFSGLEKLKAGARTDDPNAVRQVAKQFESLFARMLIKSMRDAVGKDPIFGSDQEQTYQGMFDDQLSLELTKGKGLGLADMLMRQLQHTGAAATPGGRPAVTAQPHASSAAGATTSRAPAATSTEQVNFIKDVWQQAQQAGQQLGVDPVNVVAQAALETNWGRSVPRDANGQSSNNLFGIKAGSSWAGSSAASRTQEFANGAVSTVTDDFRCYADHTQGFQDYVALLRGNPRFSGALNSGGDVHAFASALQRGGYATDPDYARKVAAVAGQVASVVGHPTVSSQDSLKFADAAPMTARTGAL